MIKRWIQRMFCKHLMTSKFPIEDPHTWSWYYHCGKCGHKQDVTVQVVCGAMPTKEGG